MHNLCSDRELPPLFLSIFHPRGILQVLCARLKRLSTMKKEPETTPSTSTTRRRSVLATGARDDEFGSSTGEERPGEDVKPVAKPEPKKRKRQQPSKPDEPKSGQWTAAKRAIL